MLQKHYRVLEALALEHEEEEEIITDLTITNLELIKRRAGAAIDEFKQMLLPTEYDPEEREGEELREERASVSICYILILTLPVKEGFIKMSRI